MGKKIVLFGAGEIGKQAMEYYGPDNIECFIDNCKEKQEKGYLGFNVKALSEMLEAIRNYELIVSVSENNFLSINNQLKESGVLTFDKFQVKARDDKFVSDTRLVRFKDMHKGKRCFIIGTGPSLTVDDLEVLRDNNEITFASNKIFKLFEKTDWRPDLYCVTDYEVLYHYYDLICNLEIDNMFIVDIADTKYEREINKELLNNKHINVFKIFKKEHYDNILNENVPNFSINPDRYVIDGGITVTYSMIQWAKYFGFSEIYLIGVDFNYSDFTGMDKDTCDHFCDDYIEKNEIVNPPKIEYSLKAYKEAEKFSRKNDFRIYNATRGGKLEVFERIDFEGLFIKGDNK